VLLRLYSVSKSVNLTGKLTESGVSRGTYVMKTERSLIVNRIVKLSSVAVAFAFLMVAIMSSVPAQAADTKVAVINIQKVLIESEAGKKAKAKVEKKMEELKSVFKKDEDALIALQKEIEKKSSAWSEEKRKEKAREFQKKRLSLGEKQEDANLEMKQLQEKNLTPIMKKLETIVTEVAKAKGYTVVLPRNGVLYFDKAFDITADTTKALNAKMK
jgi:outer membrane protein